jgi:cobalamin biosynthesis Mg chelatase CobN
MNKLILVLLIATTFSCNVIKNFRKEKSKEETKTETSIKVDSVAEVETEKEIVSTFTDETKTEFFDLSEVTIVEVFNDSGEVINRTTTTKTNVKTNVIAKGKEEKKETSSELSKVDLSKVGKSKAKHELSEVKKDKKVEKTSLPNWLWILIVIIVILFILVAIWKIPNKWLIS